MEFSKEKRLEFSIKTGSPEKLDSGCLVAGVFEGGKLSGSAAVLDKASGGRLGALIKSGDLTGKAGKTLLLHGLGGTTASRVLLVGLGKDKEFDAKAYRSALGTALSVLKEGAAGDVLLCLTELTDKKRSAAWCVRQAVMLVHEVLYRFALPGKKDEAKPRPASVSLYVAARKDVASARRALDQGMAIGTGMDLARTLGNLPANYCTPTYLAEQAVALGKTLPIEVDVLDVPQLQELGMGAFLSVAAGSRQPPKFIVMEYNGGGKGDKPIVLVGKGITFDTGGISLKPGEGMDEMKFDMCGAASVLGTMKSIASIKLPLNVVGLVPATENMPDGLATKPGDVVTSMSGQTIEILNTDAEGRLILCDALTYAERYQPACVVDIATLTGACIIALGHVASGLLANDDDLAQELLEAGLLAHDRAWQLPLWDDYQEQLKSNFADMGNIGGRPAGTVTAACFLSRFTKKYRWAHLDIAGTAWKSGKEKGATGRPVPLLAHFLLERAGLL